MGPYYRKNREYESNLHKYRVARGYTVVGLAKAAATSQITVSQVANGTLSPLYEYGKKEGQIKEPVKRILDVLSVDAEDIFPRYYCKLGNVGMLTDCQVRDITLSNGTLSDPAEIMEEKERSKQLYNSLAKLSSREMTVLIQRHMVGQTLEEIGVEHNVSRERIRQIERKGIQRFKGKYQDGLLWNQSV